MTGQEQPLVLGWKQNEGDDKVFFWIEEQKYRGKGFFPSKGASMEIFTSSGGLAIVSGSSPDILRPGLLLHFYVRGSVPEHDHNWLVATKADFFNRILPAVREYNEARIALERASNEEEPPCRLRGAGIRYSDEEAES